MNNNSSKTTYAKLGSHQELRNTYFKVRAYFSLYERNRGKEGINYRKMINTEIHFIKDCIIQNTAWTQAEAIHLWEILSNRFIHDIRKYNIPFPKKPFKSSSSSNSLGKILFSSGEFLVRINHNKEILQSFKRMVDYSGREFNKEKRVWHVAQTQANNLFSFCEKHKGFSIGDVAKQKMSDHNMSLRQSYSFENIELNIDFPQGLSLRAYQTVGVDYFLRKRRIINADTMGLGKTIQAIAGFNKIDEWPVLVVVPKNVIYNWYNEISKWSSKKPLVIDKKNSKSLLRYMHHGHADFIIVNYDGLRTHFVESIKKINKTDTIRLKPIVGAFKGIIIDEAHELKNPKTTRYKIAKEITSSISNRLLLTGTPIVNEVKDVWALISLLGREKDFGGYSKFIADYKKAKDRNRLNLTIREPLEMLNDMLRSICMVRREKHQVLSELPDKTRHEIYVDIDNQKEYKEAHNNFRDYLRKQKGEAAAKKAMMAEKLTMLGQLSQIAARGKMNQGIEFIKGIVANEKCVVFCWHKETIRQLRKHFPDMLEVSGETNLKKTTQKNVDKFQKDASAKLIVLTYRAGGVGLTLTAASKWVALELGWNPKDQRQAEDRLWRMGQKNNVMCYYFLAKDTVDQHRYNIIQKKEKIITKGIDSDEKSTTVQTELIELIAA